MEKFQAGDKVLCLFSGQWEGPFIVQSGVGRTADHLVLLNPREGVLFEQYNDSPYNLKKA